MPSHRLDSVDERAERPDLRTSVADRRQVLRHGKPQPHFTTLPRPWVENLKHLRGTAVRY